MKNNKNSKKPAEEIFYEGLRPKKLEQFQGQEKIYKSGSKTKVDTKAMALVAAKRLFPKVNLLMTDKSSVPLDGLVTEVTGKIERTESGYWRVTQVDVDLSVKYNEMNDVIRKKFERCKKLFFNYCIVSASIKEGIEINVNTNLEE